jgi:hypothetical protein
MYIIRFSQYQMLAELKQVLEEVSWPSLVAQQEGGLVARIACICVHHAAETGAV